MLLRYKQAAFCYEELILSQPTVPLYHLAYADVSGFFLTGYLSLIQRTSFPVFMMKNLWLNERKEYPLGEEF